MSADAKPTSPTPIPPAVGEFDLLHETAAHRLLADLCQQAMGDDYPVDVHPSSSCTRSLLAHILEMLALRPGDLLVNLGCGRGGPGLWLARETRARLVGLDFSPKGIALALRTAERFALPTPAQFRVASFDATGLPDASADGVVSVDALPFAPDRDAALRELRRVLRPGLAPCSRPAKPGSRISRQVPLARVSGPAVSLAPASSSIVTSRVQTFPVFGCGSTVSGSSMRSRCGPSSGIVRPTTCSPRRERLRRSLQRCTFGPSRFADRRASRIRQLTIWFPTGENPGHQPPFFSRERRQRSSLPSTAARCL